VGELVIAVIIVLDLYTAACAYCVNTQMRRANYCYRLWGTVFSDEKSGYNYPSCEPR